MSIEHAKPGFYGKRVFNIFGIIAIIVLIIGLFGVYQVLVEGSHGSLTNFRIGINGGLFGVIAARPFWNASVLPLMFFIAFMVAGMGLLTLLHLLFLPNVGSQQYKDTAYHLARIFFGRKNLLTIGTVCFLYIAGFVIVPVNIIIPRLAYAFVGLEGLQQAFHHNKLLFDYGPAAVEWLVVSFALGTALLVFTLGYRYLTEPYIKEYFPRI